MKVFFHIAECRLSYAKTVPTSGMKVFFHIAECRLSYAKIVQMSGIGNKKPLFIFLFPSSGGCGKDSVREGI
ncbi:MAG: hypothetical protein MR301_08495 [Prevotella sp.]|nr:hypothetical protein [Prevotella sp.]